jgi:hypothetical protein
MFDRKYRELMAGVERGYELNRKEFQRNRAEAGRQWTTVRAMLKELGDLRDESRAQREALLRLIDRLPPPPGEPSGN